MQIGQGGLDRAVVVKVVESGEQVVISADKYAEITKAADVTTGMVLLDGVEVLPVAGPNGSLERSIPMVEVKFEKSATLVVPEEECRRHAGFVTKTAP